MSSETPPDHPDADDDEAQADAELARRRQLAIARLRRPAKPGFRVVEVVRDGQGRARKCGSVWHPTLDVTRRFARAVAANTDGYRVLVADSSGRVLEEVPLPDPEQRRGLWDGGWRALPLPDLPKPPPQPRRLPPPPPALPVASEPVADIDVDVPIFEES